MCWGLDSLRKKERLKVRVAVSHESRVQSGLTRLLAIDFEGALVLCI